MILTETQLRNFITKCAISVLKEIHEEELSSGNSTKMCKIYSGWDDERLSDFINNYDSESIRFEEIDSDTYTAYINESLFNKEDAEKLFTELWNNNFQAFDFENKDYEKQYLYIRNSLDFDSAQDDELDAYYNEFDNWSLDL